MIQRVHNKTMQLLKESFVPVMLVAVGLGFILVYVNFKATMNADQIEIITILGNDVRAETVDAGAVVEQVAIDISDERQSDPLYKKAAEAIEKKNWQASDAIYREIIKENPSSQAYNDLGVLYYECGDTDLARQHYQEAVSIEPESEIYQKNIADF